MDDIPGVTIRNDIRPGDIGSLIRLHGMVYFEEFGYDLEFEKYVAQTFVEFLNMDSNDRKLWIVEMDGEVAGCIGVLIRSEENAQLRWLLLHPMVRGLGLAKVLIGKVIEYARERGCSSVHLLTENVLRDASRLYELFDFKIKEESEVRAKWGVRMRFQRYEKEL